MEAAAGYVAHVDRVLAAAAELLTPAPGGAGIAEAAVSRPVDAPGGTSGLSSGAVAAGERYTAAVGAATAAAGFFFFCLLFVGSAFRWRNSAFRGGEGWRTGAAAP